MTPLAPAFPYAARVGKKRPSDAGAGRGENGGPNYCNYDVTHGAREMGPSDLLEYLSKTRSQAPARVGRSLTRYLRWVLHNRGHNLHKFPLGLESVLKSYKESSSCTSVVVCTGFGEGSPCHRDKTRQDETRTHVHPSTVYLPSNKLRPHSSLSP